jgi:hypothetical protein
MRPEKYSGSASIETFLIQFSLCADYNKWSEKEKVTQLKCCLTGVAAQMLSDGGIERDVSYRKLVSKLRTRFGSNEIHELRSRRRRRGETIANLHADIRRLMALVYSDTAHSHLGQVIAHGPFIAELGDREIEFRVCNPDLSDLEAAFRAAIHI